MWCYHTGHQSMLRNAFITPTRCWCFSVFVMQGENLYTCASVSLRRYGHVCLCFSSSMRTVGTSFFSASIH